MNIKYKQYPRTHVVTVRCVVQKRAEITTILRDLAQKIPADQIAGPPFCIFNFITSVEDGSDVTIGHPVTGEIEGIKTEWLPEMEVLSIIHRGEPEKLGETVGQVFVYSDQYALMSDEFYREVYLDNSHPDGPGVEIHFIIHNWNKKLAANLDQRSRD